MIQREIEFFQQDIIKRIYAQEDPVELCEADGILKEIRTYSDDEIQYALGAFGIKLKAFSENIDLYHPDIKTIFSGHLVGYTDDKLGKQLIDVLKVSLFARDNFVSNRTLNSIKDSLSLELVLHEQLVQEIDDPVRNQLRVRLLKDHHARQFVRATKRNQSIPTYQDMASWERHPQDFSNYHRGIGLYQLDIEEAETKMQYFLGHGLPSMAQEISKGISELQEKAKSEQHYGFNKISLISASTILAKMSGFQAMTISSNQSKIMVFTTDDFKEHEFINDQKNSPNAFYCPITYTLPEFQDIASEQVRNIISYVDSFPKISNKPLFDHYRVLIPSLDYRNYSCQDWPFDFKGKFAEVKANSFESAKFEYDKLLITEKIFVGVLLGELDGDYYFVSYFN